jgi:TonB family protein
MKFCPKCQTKYDDEILRFCKIDGTPLISETPPSFTALPSQSSINISDELGEDTIIARKKPDNTAPLQPPYEEPRQRIVVQTSPPEIVKAPPQSQFQTTPKKKSNTAATVFLTLFGTLAVLGGGVGVWWFLSGNGGANAGANKPNNVNQTANLAALNGNVVQNINADNSNYNFNYNAVSGNSNANVNANFTANIGNANLKTPTPTPKPTPKPTVKTLGTNVNANVKANTNSNVNTAVGNTNVNAKPISTNTNTVIPKTPTPKPATTPATNTAPKNVSVGNLTSRAVSLPKPAYPPIAKQAGANGQVIVQVTVDEEGNVLSAKAVSGNMLLRSPAEAAARQAKFSAKIGGENVKAVGTLVYNFVN